MSERHNIWIEQRQNRLIKRRRIPFAVDRIDGENRNRANIRTDRTDGLNRKTDPGRYCSVERKT